MDSEALEGPIARCAWLEANNSLICLQEVLRLRLKFVEREFVCGLHSDHAICAEQLNAPQLIFAVPHDNPSYFAFKRAFVYESFVRLVPAFSTQSEFKVIFGEISITHGC